MSKIKSRSLSFIFTVLILDGFVTILCSAIFLPPCEEIPSKCDFNESYFFNGTWYLTYILPTEGRYTIHDPRYNLKIEPKLYGTHLYQNYTVTSPRNSIKNFHGFATIIKGLAKYVTELRAVTKDDVQPVMLETIVDTDYKNYAIGYYCVSNDSSLLGTNFAILSRNPNPKKIHPELIKKLRTFGLQLNRFKPVNYVEKKMNLLKEGKILIVKKKQKP